MYKSIYLFFIIVIILNPSNVIQTIGNEEPSNQLNNQSSTKSNIEIRNTLQASIESEVIFNITKTGNYYDGYNLFVLREISRTDSSTNYNTLLITDMDGNIVYEKNLGEFHSLDYLNTEMINSTTLLYGSPFGPRLLNLETNLDIPVGRQGHHDYEYNYKSNTIFTLEFYETEIDGEFFIYDKITEYSLDGQLVWEFDTFPLVPITNEVYGDSYAPNNQKDVTHANTIFYDNEEDTIYLNARNANTFWKIDHSTGQVIWGLGEYGNFTLVDKVGNIKESLFYNAHAVEKIDDNRFILFDNGRHNRTDLDSKNSSIVEIEVDENQMKAFISWKWTAPRTYYSAIWGDADRLPNGNRFGTFGTTTHPNTEIGARLVEVNQDGEIVWELNFPLTKSFTYGVYRAERINFLPNIAPAPDVQTLPKEEIEVKWDVWYNFRSKIQVNGSYSIFLNNTLIDNGDFIFKKYWRKKALNMTLNGLKIGNYELRLEIKDEAGQKSIDAVNISVLPFFIRREGPTMIEQGFVLNKLIWKGDTVIPYNFNLFVNETKLNAGIWDGDNPITFNLNVLNPADYNLKLELSNQSQILFTDIIMIQVRERQPPEILSNANFIQLDWNTTGFIGWEIGDFLPNKYSLSRNGIIITENLNWTFQNFYFQTDLIGLNEGIHNFTLVAIDKYGAESSKTVIVEINPPIIPVIIIRQNAINFKWGESAYFDWEIHGGNEFKLFRNTTLIASGNIALFNLRYEFDFQGDLWRLGKYELKLVILNNRYETISLSEILIFLVEDHPYANLYIPQDSINLANGDFATNKPDGQVAQISTGYTNGYLTLDMGDLEEVFDGIGNDFLITASGGRYRISVYNEIFGQITNLGEYQNTTEIDINGKIDKFRYIRIEYLAGKDILVDAITGINYNSPNYSELTPSIQDYEDFYFWSNETYFAFTWIVSSATPWNYSVFIDGKIADSGPWYGDNILINQTISRSKIYSVKLMIFNLFETYSSDTMNVHITPQLYDPEVFLKFTGFLIFTFVALFLLPYRLIRRF